jgi:hypothetical protein
MLLRCADMAAGFLVSNWDYSLILAVKLDKAFQY